MKRLTLLLLSIMALAAAAAPAAQAARDQEATFQDDNQLLYTTPAAQKTHLDTLKGLGVDRIRVTILWKAIAPAADSTTRPTFDATDPNAYAAGAWRSYDTLVKEAYARGMRVNFDVTGPAPLWANGQAPRPDIADTYEPSAAEYSKFVTALGRRYSGTWSDGDGGLIPRVDYWSIWNEPNHSGWLTPTWQKSGGRFFERSASLYRELLDAGFAALGATGHGSDTILIGETAPTGTSSKNVKRFMKPLVFLRALYCVDRKLHRLKGTVAKRLKCPSTGKAFRTQHPALFSATGFAHHPYQLLTAPNVKPRDKDYVTMGVLPRLTHALDTMVRRYGSHKKFPLYLTEYGYQTPPDLAGVPLSAQARFINQSEHIASRNPRVRTLSQFLLLDDGPPIGTTFQSGLIARTGKKKPSFQAYRMPLWVSGKGSRKHVWSVLRPAAKKVRAKALVQFRPRSGKRFRTIKHVTSSGARNVVSATVHTHGSGSVRIVYGRIHSRSATVH